MLRPHRSQHPSLGNRTWVAENATLVGDVVIGDDSSIWFGTVIRGDVHSIRIGARTNIQDNCTIHVTTAMHDVVIGDEVTVGHGVIAHGCHIDRGALIGMGSRVLDGAHVGELALVGAGALVSEGMNVPPRTLVLGIPAKVKRDLTTEEIERLESSWKHYVELKDVYLQEGNR